MITGELKSKVDRIWDTMWSGGISNPLSVIEQLTYLLFIKRLDELHTLREHKAARTGKPIKEPVFTAKQDKLRWSRFKEAAPETMFETVRDGVFPFIKALGANGQSDGEVRSTYTHHMKDALFMMPTAHVLANVVDQLDSIDMTDSDTKGDLYEYMLGKIATAGQNGQFRTPRHIIKLMVDMTAPTPKDVICDPACGSASLLMKCGRQVVENSGTKKYALYGQEAIGSTWALAKMNMFLHGEDNHIIKWGDTLRNPRLLNSDETLRHFDVVVANILARPLIQYAESITSCIAGHGMLVLSGVLCEQADDVMVAYEPWVEFDEPVFREQDGQDWTRLTGTRRAG